MTEQLIPKCFSCGRETYDPAGMISLARPESKVGEVVEVKYDNVTNFPICRQCYNNPTKGIYDFWGMRIEK